MDKPLSGSMPDLVRNYERFFDSSIIRDFRRRGGRVFVATEHRPIEAIQSLYALGHRDFSEKFVQEAMEKDIAGKYPDINLHFFGCLQSNKIGKVTRLFDCVESLEKESAATKLRDAMAMRPHARLKNILVEINTGCEPQKRGVLPHRADDLIRYCQDLRLPLEGLMAIPPRQGNPEPHFRLLRAIADRHKLEHCFMGMSADFALAIKAGSTAIRIGRALFSGPDSGVPERESESELGCCLELEALRSK